MRHPLTFSTTGRDLFSSSVLHQKGTPMIGGACLYEHIQIIYLQMVARDSVQVVDGFPGHCCWGGMASNLQPLEDGVLAAVYFADDLHYVDLVEAVTAKH